MEFLSGISYREEEGNERSSNASCEYSMNILGFKCSCVFLALLAPNVSLADDSYTEPPIAALNQFFRQVYGSARQAEIDNPGPTIIATGDQLTLLVDGSRYVGTSIDPRYHDLKAIAHVPLAIYCIVGASLDQPLADEEINSLKELRTLIEAVEDSVDTTFEEPNMRRRQKRILRRCDEFIAHATSAGRASSADVNALVETLRPDLMKGVAESVRLRLDNYHRQMLAWRQMLSQEQFQQLTVLIPGAPLPRKNNLTVQYFAKLFGQEGEGPHIIYAESRYDEQDVMELLGTHHLDSKIGQVFFDNSTRMNRDLLGPSASTYLDRLDFEAFR